jgi:superfamily II DNA or RNA helicase
MSSIQLRDYQQKIVDEVISLPPGSRRVVWLPTGGGKTEISCAIAQSTEKKVLFLVDKIVLVKQAEARFTKYGMIPNIIQGQNTLLRGSSNVTIASVQTLSKEKRFLLIEHEIEDIGYIIVDEAHIFHKAHNKIIKAITKANPEAKVIGLSATPLRKGMKEMYHDLIRGPSYGELITSGSLVKPRYFCPDSHKLVEAGLAEVKVSKASGDYDTGQLSRQMRVKKIVGCVVDEWLRIASDRSTIVFCVDIAHSKEVAEEFYRRGIEVAQIDHYAKDEERESLIKRFNGGEIRVLTSVNVLSIGFDSPIASCAILARPTLSTMLHIQQVGRVLRPYEGKKDAIIIDHAGNVFKHGKIEEFSPQELKGKHIFEVESKIIKKEKPTVKQCRKCGFLNDYSAQICEECGAMFEKKGMVVVELAGALKELEKEEKRNISQDHVKSYYLQALYVAREMGYKDGWAYYRTLDKYGHGTRIPSVWKFEKPLMPIESDLRKILKYWRKKDDREVRVHGR